MMYDWREVWRTGIAPQLSTKGLEALRDGLAFDDPEICQGRTAVYASAAVGKPAMMRACAVGFAVWKGLGLQGVNDVQLCAARIFGALSTPVLDFSGCWSQNVAANAFWAFFDDQPRQKAFAELLEEVERELSLRRPEEVPVECGEPQGVCA